MGHVQMDAACRGLSDDVYRLFVNEQAGGRPAIWPCSERCAAKHQQLLPPVSQIGLPTHENTRLDLQATLW